MIDLAHKPPVPMPITADQPSEPSYPSLRLSGEQAASLGLDTCALGDTYDVTIRIKAANIGKDGSTFDIVSAQDKPQEVDDGDSAEEEAAENKASKPKPKPKPETVKPPKSRILKPPMDDSED